ncbi:MAG: GNAT family N-acetyltransferase [Gaiellales bacterium]
MDPATVVRDVILREGTTLRLRATTHADADDLLAFFSQLSEESRYFRFHGFEAATRELVKPFLDPDWHERGDLVAVVDENGAQRITALASWARLRDPARAEVSFAVEDRLQRHGVGTRLLEQLAATAAEAGIEEFVAEVLQGNTAMLGVFREAGFELRRATDGATIEVTFPIAPTEAYRARIDTRDHEAVVASLRPFFTPAAVTVLGASSRGGSIGGAVLRNIVEGGFEGKVYPVNRRGEAVAGLRGFDSVEELPEVPDLAVVCLPAEAVLEGVGAVLRRGTRAVCVISAGFAETGHEGAAREAELLALVRGYGSRLLGPNCLGLSAAASHLNATFAPHAFPSGRIGFSSQSGALGLALLEESAARGLGFSAFVSIGNKADVSSNDLLEYWEEDDDTTVVVLYVESFGNPHKFARLARRVARSKPVIALKSGVTRAGARAAASHTAALASSEAAVRALFRQAGVVRASSLEDLVDAAALFSSQPLPRGRRVAILTNAGGFGILCADACDGAGLEVIQLQNETRAALEAVLPNAGSAANPIDLLGSATAKDYEAALEPVLADANVDAVFVLFAPTAAVDAASIWAVIEESRRAAADPRPVITAVMAAERPAGAFPYPESAVRAFARAVERAEWLRRPAGSVPEVDGIEAGAAETIIADDTWLEPGPLRRLLEAYGIPLVAEVVARSPDEAVKAAHEVGLPCVVKTAEAGVHKTEIGGVALNLATEEAVRAAAERIGSPVLVQPMVTGGSELLAGLVQDPVFGALIAFGPGGELAELVGEAGFAIAPLTDADAEELVSGGKVGRLVRGYRGRPAADEHALADLLHRLSRLGDEHPEVAELDLNPVIARPDGCIALDARVHVRRPERAVRLKTW